MGSFFLMSRYVAKSHDFHERYIHHGKYGKGQENQPIALEQPEQVGIDQNVSAALTDRQVEYKNKKCADQESDRAHQYFIKEQCFRMLPYDMQKLLVYVHSPIISNYQANQDPFPTWMMTTDLALEPKRL